MTGNGMRAGANAFSASRSITIESLPPEKSSTGRSNSAITLRITKMLSASRASRCETRYGFVWFMGLNPDLSHVYGLRQFRRDQQSQQLRLAGGGAATLRATEERDPCGRPRG